MDVVVWFGWMWWCGLGGCGGVVWVDVVVWFGWMWWCGLDGCGGVVWMEVVVFGDDQVGVGDKLVLLLL